MKAIVFLASALLVAPGIAAQTPAAATASARQDAPASRYQPFPNPGVEPVECLRHKASGHRICKTRAEWQQLAARIDQGKYPRR